MASKIRDTHGAFREAFRAGSEPPVEARFPMVREKAKILWTRGTRFTKLDQICYLKRIQKACAAFAFELLQFAQLIKACPPCAPALLQA